MQLPRAKLDYPKLTRFGRYLARRLRRSKLEALAKAADAANQAVRGAGRALEEADDALQDALADRDAIDDSLDAAAQDLRNRLAGRGTDAVKEEPYTLVFHAGIGYYIAASLDDQKARYEELCSRVEKALPTDEPLRVSTVSIVRQGLSEWDATVAALTTARAEASMRRTDLDVAMDAWRRQMERTYGSLVAEVGRTAAERFFPKARRATKKRSGDDGGGDDGGGSDL